MFEASKPENWGDQNKKLIVELVKKDGPLSRAELKRRTGMSFPAVSSNVQFLLERDYLFESGIGNNAIGRKSKLLSFNSKRGYVIGIDLGRSRISLVLSDLMGNPVHQISKDVDIYHGRLNIIEHLDNLIRNALAKVKIEECKLIGIGIGIPGVLDRNTGRIILVPFAEEWTKYNLLEGMKSRFTCPVCFENSVNLGALGEKWRGCGVPFHNIFYINYSIGIGSALIINDELFTGSNGVAGEIGYSIPSPSHIRTNFKEEGVLEELISGKALDERIKSLNLGLNSLKELFESKSEVFENLRQDILAKVKDLFFVILLASISVINPSVVILSGRIGINLGKLLKEDWEKALNAHFRFPPKLLISEQGSMANVYGAVRLALSHIDDELSAS